MKKQFNSAYLYLRASSVQQDKSVSQQRLACRDYAKRNNINILDEFEDDGVSAYKDNLRSGFQSLIQACNKKKVDYVLLWDINRFSRRYKEGMIELLSLEVSGVKLIDTVSGVYDSEEMTGALKQFLGMWGSQDYSKKLSHSVSRGLKDMRANGFLHGVAPLGYKRVQVKGGTEWVPDSNSSSIVNEIFTLYDSGLNFTQISNRLNTLGFSPKRAKYFSSSAIKVILRNESYGGLQYGKRAKITTFIDKSLWKRCYERATNSGKKFKHKGQRKNPLTGIVICGECGQQAHIVCGGHSINRYMCRARRWNQCQNRNYIEQELIEQATIDCWKKLLVQVGIENLARESIENALKLAKQNAKDTQPLFDRLEELNVAEANLLDLAVKGGKTELLAKRLQTISDERESIQSKIGNLDSDIPYVDLEVAVERIVRVMEQFSNLTKLSEHITSIEICGKNEAKIEMFGRSEVVKLERKVL